VIARCCLSGCIVGIVGGIGTDVRGCCLSGGRPSPLPPLQVLITCFYESGLTTGKVKGGRILGEYPSDLTEESSLNLGRGRIQPTTSWESLWNGIAIWFGITDEKDLDAVLPYRKYRTWYMYLPGNEKLYSDSDLFVSSSVDEGKQECSQDELVELCGLEEDPSSGNAQRVRRLSEKQVTEDPQKDASYLLVLTLFGAAIGTALVIFIRPRN